MFEPSVPKHQTSIRDGLPVAAIKEERRDVQDAASAPLDVRNADAEAKYTIASRRGRGITQWGMVVAFLYLLIFVAITCPVIAFADYPRFNLTEAAKIYWQWPYWVWVGIMFACQAALLVLPIRLERRRPTSRRPLIYPALVSGLMMGILALGAFFTVWQLMLVSGKKVWEFESLLAWPTVWVGCTIWAAWAAIFWEMSRHRNVAGAIAAQSCTMLTGSILEVLVAIPTHIAARNRAECCAGIGSFIGLTLGMSVMLFAFGPAVFFLYLNRWRQLRRGQRLAGVAKLNCHEERVPPAWPT